MKKCTSLLGLGASLLLGLFAPAQAAINAVDNVPAATLMLPYFQVDASNPNAERTILNVGNRSPAERLAHVVLWSDRGVPTYSFNLRIDGYGISEVDVTELFRTGTLPASTAGGFVSCSGQLPPPALDATTLAGLRNAHSGQPSSLLGGQCASTPHGDANARGYLTIDVVNACTNLVPGDAGYFVLGGGGIARNDNVLWGEYSVSSNAQGYAYGDALVHIEASATDAATDGAGDYTFYGRRVGMSGADNREILPSVWNGRYSLQDVLFRTTAVVWRDAGNVAPFACGSPPAAASRGGIFAFDDQENVSFSAEAMRVSLATQSVRLDDPAESGIPYSAGFVRYELALNGNPQATPNQAFVSHLTASLYGDRAQAPAWAMDLSNQGSVPIQISQCADGIDNDGDGLIDFPADPGCRSADDGLEAPQCSDGTDNDGDGLIDFPADPECGAAYDQSEGFIAACDDGIDNDLDGRIDYPADPQCNFPNDNTENLGQCDDGIDNDGDGLIDFPADPGCSGPGDDETPSQCGDGTDNDGDGLIDFPADLGCTSINDNNEVNPVCIDGTDNDGDGLIDFPADPSCPNANGTSEDTQCSDGVDNDGDGTIDLADPTCGGVASNNQEFSQCSDGIDNDGDGNIDFPADPGCSTIQDNSEGNDPPQCNDNLDNNGDGLIDFPDDPTCTFASDPFEAPDCSDGIDNDFDGAADFPADPGCASATDLNELSNAITRACSDGIDNDGDGQIDYPADTSCTSTWDDVEFSPTGTGIAITVNPPTLPTGQVNQIYSVTFTATGGLTPYTYTSTALPAGLTLAPGGLLSGTPTTSGAFPITVTATDANDFVGSRSYTLLINGAVPVVPVPALSVWAMLAMLLLLAAIGSRVLRRV